MVNFLPDFFSYVEVILFEWCSINVLQMFLKIFLPENIKKLFVSYLMDIQTSINNQIATKQNSMLSYVF